MPSVNHFILFIENVDNKNFNIQKNKKYYYDSIDNDGLIDDFDDDIEKIIDSKYGYIFCYKKIEITNSIND